MLRATQQSLFHIVADVTMGGLAGFLVVYLLGGLTFIPLLIVAVLLHAYLTLPIHEDNTYGEREIDPIIQPGDDIDAIKRAQKTLGDRFQPRNNNESDVAAGYFAIYREYVPAAATTAPPANQSVYQSMYRSIFDRKQSSSPLDNKGVGRPQRKGGNVFYVVLRYGTVPYGYQLQRTYRFLVQAWPLNAL